jgi:hypothetical protein
VLTIPFSSWVPAPVLSNRDKAKGDNAANGYEVHFDQKEHASNSQFPDSTKASFKTPRQIFYKSGRYMVQYEKGQLGT